MAQERTAWHPDVHVRFQKKAWADDVLCEEVAGKEIAEATAEARAAGERSVVFFDNLSGQTTPEHLRALKWKAKADRHLLPTNTTSELMHIDDGIAEVTWAAPRMAPFARMAIVFAVRRGLAHAVARDWRRAALNTRMLRRRPWPPRRLPCRSRCPWPA